MMRAFETAEKADWCGGVPLADLLGRVNQIAAKLLPDGDGHDSRVSRVFSPRSFRHYQTLGCIDAPERVGKRVVYGFRHFVQALLVRRLLWERMPSERIVVLMAGRSTAETRTMLLDGVEFFVRAGAGEKGREVVASLAPGLAEAWKRIQVAPGVELHIRAGLPKRRPGALKQTVELLERALRKNL